MMAVIYDRIIRRYKAFLLFLIVSTLAIVISGFNKPFIPALLYIFLCFYWNGYFKMVGMATNWKLLWSLPISESEILVGTAIANVILGWSMNAALFLLARIWVPLPLLVLLFPCAISLISDLFIMGIDYVKGSRIKAAVGIVWFIFVYGLPLLIRGARLERLLLQYQKWPLYLKIVPFLIVYLIGLVILRALYRYFKRNEEITQA